MARVLLSCRGTRLSVQCPDKAKLFVRRGRKKPAGLYAKMAELPKGASQVARPFF